MWDGDSRWYRVPVRVLVGSVVAVTLSLSAWSIWQGDWESLLGVGFVVVAPLVFLGLYAAAVWLIGHSVRGLWRLLRRLVSNPGSRT